MKLVYLIGVQMWHALKKKRRMICHLHKSPNRIDRKKTVQAKTFLHHLCTQNTKKVILLYLNFRVNSNIPIGTQLLC